MNKKEFAASLRRWRDYGLILKFHKEEIQFVNDLGLPYTPLTAAVAISADRWTYYRPCQEWVAVRDYQISSTLGTAIIEASLTVNHPYRTWLEKIIGIECFQLGKTDSL